VIRTLGEQRRRHLNVTARSAARRDDNLPDPFINTFEPTLNHGPRAVGHDGRLLVLSRVVVVVVVPLQRVLSLSS
jgi:hypothetical protein